MFYHCSFSKIISLPGELRAWMFDPNATFRLRKQIERDRNMSTKEERKQERVYRMAKSKYHKEGEKLRKIKEK
jgi:hypothetical protein